MVNPEPSGAAPGTRDAARRVLAVRLDNVGDLIMLGPAPRALRSNLPAAHVTLLASNAGSQVAAMPPWVDDLMVERVVWQDGGRRLDLDPGREHALDLLGQATPPLATPTRSGGICVVSGS